MRQWAVLLVDHDRILRILHHDIFEDQTRGQTVGRGGPCLDPDAVVGADEAAVSDGYALDVLVLVAPT